METIKKKFDLAKTKYDQNGRNPLSDIRDTAEACLKKLFKEAEVVGFGTLVDKHYSIYTLGKQRSRPFLLHLMLSPKDYVAAWDVFVRKAQTHRFDVSEDFATKVVYTTVMSFAICYDLWKPGSRKTPGTFLEVVLGSILSTITPEASRSKFIKLYGSEKVAGSPQSEPAKALDLESLEDIENFEEGDEPVKDGSVSTDIVLEFTNGHLKQGIVIPAKITTRERIVQPFAHQRILDSAFGEGRYISLLLCVSETQRDDKNGRVNDICVPGTIKLFQQYLARLGGIYYLDPPRRYLELSSSGVIPVASIGNLLTSGFREIVRQLETSPAAPNSRSRS